MNILFVGSAQGFGNASRYYMIPHKLVNGLTRNGHNVYMFNDKDYARASNLFKSTKLGRAAVNTKLVEIARDFQPSLVMLGHVDQIGNEVLDAVRAVCPDVRIVYRNVDPLYGDNIRKIENRLPAVDGVFITTAGDSLRQFANARSFVCFMPNPIDASIETERAYANTPSADVFFAGGYVRDAYDARRDVVEWLQETLGPEAIRFRIVTGDNALFGRAYIDALGQSAIGLSLNKTDDHYLYASDRMAQYLGNGLFVMADRRSGFQDLFGADEMGFFDDKAQLAELIRYYVRNDEARRRGAARACEKAHRIFDASRVTRFIIEKSFGLPLSQDYDWPTDSF